MLFIVCRQFDFQESGFMVDSNGKNDENLTTEEERMAEIEKKTENKKSEEEERLLVLEKRSHEIEIKKKELDDKKTEEEKTKEEARKIEHLSEEEKEKLVKIEAKLKKKQEQDDRLKRIERITSMERKIAESTGVTTPATNQVNYVRARGARIGSWMFYILLAAGLVMLVPDLLQNLAEVNILESYGGWLFEPMDAPLDTVTGLGMVGISFIVAAIVILVAMMVVYRKR